MVDKTTGIPAKEVREMYGDCSERDRIFLKAVLDMLVAIYCTPKDRKEEHNGKRL